MNADFLPVRYLTDEALQLFEKLRHHQIHLDPYGALNAPTSDTESQEEEERTSKLCKAMTLRDCTLFLLKRANGDVEARLGDLDLKHADKLARWQETERSLYAGRWYEGRDKVCLRSPARRRE